MPTLLSTENAFSSPSERCRIFSFSFVEGAPSGTVHFMLILAVRYFRLPSGKLPIERGVKND
jgi:hypothetical protein